MCPGTWEACSDAYAQGSPLSQAHRAGAPRGRCWNELSGADTLMSEPCHLELVSEAELVKVNVNHRGE